MAHAPMAKWMPDKASYYPKRLTTTPHKDQILARAVRCWDRTIRKFAQDLDDIQIVSLRPNRTGRKINVRARIGGRSATFSVFPYQTKTNDFRTPDSLLQEVTILLSKRVKVTDDGEEKDIVAAIAWRADLLGQQSTKKEYFGPAYAEPVLADRVRTLVPDGGGFSDFHRAVTDFVKQGKLDENFDGHQVKRALDQYKDMALHALRHGARLDDMQTILDEAIVQVTLEC